MLRLRRASLLLRAAARRNPAAVCDAVPPPPLPPPPPRGPAASPGLWPALPSVRGVAAPPPLWAWLHAAAPPPPRRAPSREWASPATAALLTSLELARGLPLVLLGPELSGRLFMPGDLPVLAPVEAPGSAAPALEAATKRTYQPSVLIRKRRHGFLSRLYSVGGRRVLQQRKAKGRRKLSA